MGIKLLTLVLHVVALIRKRLSVINKASSSPMAENCNCKIIQSFGVERIFFASTSKKKKHLRIDSGDFMNVYHVSRAALKMPRQLLSPYLQEGMISPGL